MSLQETFLTPAAAARARAIEVFDVASTGVSTQAVAKRATDLIIGTLALLLLSPVLAIAALAIYLESDGPVLFRQTRLGQNGKPFDIFKFRSMRVTESGDKFTQAVRGDARVTKVGRIIRATSIDELPQLLNVLSGEMSLVGPRPHPRAMDKEFGALIPTYNLRQRVKPGMTGLAQVHGHRGATPTLESMRERIAFDNDYAEQANLLLDLKILMRTPIEVVRATNAY